MDILLELFSLKLPQNAIMLLPFMNILLKRSFDAGYTLVNANPTGPVTIGGMRANPDFLTITDAGRTFIADLGIFEM